MATFVVPSVFGKPINIWMGLLLAVLVAFQILTGLRVIKLPFRVHKVNGLCIGAIVVAHALIGIMVAFDGWVY